MKSILVTGANGFVGRYLLKELSRQGIHTIAIGGPNVTHNKDYLANKYLKLDLSSKIETRQIDFEGIESVIHLAGLADVGKSFKKPLQYITNNIGIEINLFETALEQNKFPKFLIISSGNLYDHNNNLPLNEKSKILPSSPYAISKMGQEQVGLYYISRGFKCIIARPFNHIGPGQKLGFLIPDLTKQIVEIERNHKNKLIVGNLETKRDYTDVRDIVRAYILLLKNGKSGEIYNICSGKPISGYEIVNKLLKLSGVNPKLERDLKKYRPIDNLVLYGSNNKIKKDTNWKTEINISQTLTDVLNYWRKNK